MSSYVLLVNPILQSNCSLQYSYQIHVVKDILLPVDGGKPLFKLPISTDEQWGQMTKIEQQRKREVRRGKSWGKWHQEWEWDDRESERKLSKSESPSVDANAILCFTRLDRHTWNGPVKQHDVQQGYWESLNQLELLSLPSARSFLSTVPCTAIIADQLCGPLGAPVNQGPPPYSVWIQTITTSWEFKWM